MKRNTILVLFAILLLGINQNALAVDPSIYMGRWETKTKELSMVLEIYDEVIISIDNRNFDKQKPEYLYGKSAIFPFLFLRVHLDLDSKTGYLYEDHEIYLIVGETEEEGTMHGLKLRGFYEISRTKDDHYGSTVSKSYPIELFRTK